MILFMLLSVSVLTRKKNPEIVMDCYLSREPFRYHNKKAVAVTIRPFMNEWIRTLLRQPYVMVLFII